MNQEEISVEDAALDPKIFYSKYVAVRRPVKFSGVIDDPTWQAGYWSNDYLREKSGDSELRIEYRSGISETFGRGQEKIMKFREFLDALESTDKQGEMLYLTTQELKYSHEGRPSIISAPVDGLVGDFPWIPRLCGNLVPQNINLWMGSSPVPATTGLHHDFHDNLYILLRGEKTFTLLPPSEAPNLYTFGEIVKIHPNGRINYKGQLTNADGSDEAAMKAWKASQDLDAAAALLEQKGSGGGDGDGEGEVNVDEVEDQIEDALEALLDAEMEGNGDDFNGEEDEEEDDEEDEEEDEEEFGSKLADYIDTDDESGEEDGHEPSQKKARTEKATSSNNSKARDNSDSLLPGKTATTKNPLSFSRVNTALPEKEIREQFPLFYDILQSAKTKSPKKQTAGSGGTEASPRYMEVTVKAGEMLYIPCGWFHEVRSKGSGAEGHMAFNYWFHPPDGESFEKPYKTDFWRNEWNSRNLQKL